MKVGRALFPRNCLILSPLRTVRSLPPPLTELAAVFAIPGSSNSTYYVLEVARWQTTILYEIAAV